MRKPISYDPYGDRDTVLWGVFFEKLLENIDASVIVADISSRVVFTNGTYLDIFGVREKDIIGEKWEDNIIPSGFRSRIRYICEGIRANNEICLFDSPVVCSGGGKKFFRWLALPLKEGEEFFYMFIGREEDEPDEIGVIPHVMGEAKKHAAYQEVVETLFAASRLTEPETAKHAARVMVIAVILAKELGMDMVSIGKLKVASLLHDLGKLAVDPDILFKPGKLDPDEFEEIKKHPLWGADVIRLVYFLRDIIPIMANHHENWDGSGYPDGVSGEDIPIEARVLSVADIYEALTADRAYRKGFSRDEAVKIIEEEKGKKLDPEITDVFLSIVSDGRLDGDFMEGEI